MDRRKFFASAIAFVASILTTKSKVPQPKRVAAPWQPFMEGANQPYAYVEDGHTFYVFPEPPFTFKLPQFHRHAFTLSTPPLTADQVDAAFDEVNRMIDRWATEPMVPKIEHTAWVQS